MSVNDMESWAVKTILLLYSKADDSTEQLRAMLEEAIRQKYSNRKLLRPIPGPGYMKKPSVSSQHHTSLDDETNSKRPKGEFKSLKVVRPSDVVYSLNSSSDVSSDDSDDIGMEILEDDLACIVCREMASGPRNRLLECSECHCLYHQECHFPNITDMDVNDPRVVWYCVNCSKSVAKPKSTVNAGTNSGNNKSNYKSHTTPRANQPSPVLPFGSKPFGGLPGPSKKQATSSNKAAPSTSKSATSNNIISADRRLQIMKKRAAKKQEKRILAK